tara:strand:- start:335 stop:841 length:507 start_codon:yes stop_codon:yes gene_type:complete
MMNDLLFSPGVATRALMLAALTFLPQAVLANESALLADIKMVGDDNFLTITQESGPNGANPSRPNTIAVAMRGDRNGGYASQWYSGPRFSSLTPGDLFQSGFSNAITIAVVGDDNLFAVAQTGENNRVQGSVTGSFNQFAATQTGSGNSVGFAQTGQGNTIVVSQNSW